MAAGDPLFKSKSAGVNPRQKRIMMVVGAAAVLALLFMLSRGQGGGGEEATVSGVAGGEPPFGTGSTFADNGEAAAGLSTAITDGLADVSTSLYDVAVTNEGVMEGLASLGERIEADEVPPVAAAPGPAGASGQPAATSPGPPAAKKPTVKRDRFGRTPEDKAKIKRERLRGKENKQGWTPTEQKLATKNPAFSNFLVKRTKTERKEEKKQEADKRAPDARAVGAKPDSKPDGGTGGGRVVPTKPRNASTPPRGQEKPPARRKPAGRR